MMTEKKMEKMKKEQKGKRKSSFNESKAFLIRLPPQIHAELKEIAAEYDIPVASFCRSIIIRYVVERKKSEMKKSDNEEKK